MRESLENGQLDEVFLIKREEEGTYPVNNLKKNWLIGH